LDHSVQKGIISNTFFPIILIYHKKHCLLLCFSCCIWYGECAMGWITTESYFPSCWE